MVRKYSKSASKNVKSAMERRKGPSNAERVAEAGW